MRFATIRTDDGTTAARLDGDVLIPLDSADVGEMLSRGGEGPGLARQGARPVPVAEADFAPVVPRPGKIICVGLNYRSHILETGRELPEYPTLFAKFAETLTGPHDDITIPSVSERVDWEVELGVVIGRPVYRATPGDVGDAADLEVRCEVDGAVRQQSRTSDLLFKPAEIVSYASQAITLRPGDLIATGTCGGVGDARQPPVYLQPGNVLRTWVEGLGECLNHCVADKHA